MVFSTARFEAGRDRSFSVAADVIRDAKFLAPSTGRVLDHPGVVERRLARIEIGVAPNSAERVEAGAPGVAGVEVNAGRVM